MRVVDAEEITGKGQMLYVENCDAELYDLIVYDGYVWEIRGIGYIRRGNDREVTELKVRKANAMRV